MGWDGSPSQDNIHTDSYLGVHLTITGAPTSMILGGGKKLENPEEPHADMGKT